MINITPSLPIKLSEVHIRGSRLEVRAKPRGLLGWLVQLFGGGEDARIVADASTCVVEKRTLAGRERVVMPTASLDAAMFARSTKLLKRMAALFFAGWTALFLLAYLNTNEIGLIVPLCGAAAGFFNALTSPFKADFGVVSGGVFQGLSMQFKQPDLDRLQGAMTCLEALITGQQAPSKPFDFFDAADRFDDPPGNLESDGSEFDWGEEPDPPPAPPNVRECPSCGQKLRSKKSLVGKRITCPGCNKTVQF